MIYIYMYDIYIYTYTSDNKVPSSKASMFFFVSGYPQISWFLRNTFASFVFSLEDTYCKARGQL